MKSDHLPTEINSRSSCYFIAQARQRCEGCTELTPVIGFILPAGHEEFEIADDQVAADARSGTWISVNTCAIVFDIEYLCDSIKELAEQCMPGYRVAVDESTGQSVWMNHCVFCGMQQTESALYCEPEGAFMPTSPETCARILVGKVRERFAAQVGGYAYSPEFFEQAHPILSLK